MTTLRFILRTTALFVLLTVIGVALGGVGTIEIAAIVALSAIGAAAWTLATRNHG